MKPVAPTMAGDLLEQALAVPIEIRAGFLDSACGGDQSLRAELNSLLSALGAADSFLERPLIDPAAFQRINTPGLMAGAVVGDFTIIRRIASGGMGVVYEAMQEHPRRVVALKVLRQGLASPGTLRRFEYEIEVLARLRHPNIAQIFGAGMHDDGSGSVPWFAMEYVPDARTLTAYANEKDLDLPRRLELFVKVCEAVHHGHQKGIIHRDLKPGNILTDSAGEPKIIDFGVARAAGSDLIAATMHTEAGQLVGTVQYMSPEQCAADPHDLDTRTDVYSLGIVLYEMLAGRCPYDLSQTPIIRAARIIAETKPDRLSSIDSALRGDLETIVLKALEKERERRYQSAAELGDDIRRYLRREPIVARPASVMYQARMLARRHRALAAALGALFVMLVAGIIIISTFWAQARIARDENRRMADTAFDIFREQLAIAVRVADDAGSAVVAKETLDALARRLEARPMEHPELEARLRGELAQGNRFIASFGEAERHAAAALGIARSELGDEHPITIQMMIWLAEIYRDLTQHNKAETMYRAVIELEKRTRLRAEWDLGSWSNFADMLHDIGRLDDAEKIYDELLKLIPLENDEGIVNIHDRRQLAGVYRDQGRYAEAEALLLALLRDCERIWPQASPGTHHIQRDLGRLYLAEGRWEDSRRMQQKSIEGQQPALARLADDADALMTLALGAEIDLVQGRLKEAHDTFADAANRADQFLRSEQQWWAANFRTGQGVCLMRLQRYDEAKPMLLEAYSILHNRLGDIHHRTQNCIGALAELYDATDRPDEAALWRARLRPQTTSGLTPPPDAPPNNSALRG